MTIEELSNKQTQTIKDWERNAIERGEEIQGLRKEIQRLTALLAQAGQNHETIK
jgi:hypothetical protein